MTATQVNPSPEGVPGAVTDPTRIAAEDLTFASADGTRVRGYLARPATPEHPRSPGMIVIHEAGGLNEHIRDVTDRFANIGYVSLAVDLYTREGGPPPTGDLQALMQRLFSMADQTVLADLEGPPSSWATARTSPTGSAAWASAWEGATRCCSPARAND
jgi:carboxymethylenebutenolidase